MEDTKQPVRRLCSEIQLFDLCDLDACDHKDGRFCTDPKILERFEAIKEEDESSHRYLAEEFEDEEEGEDEESYSDEEYDEEE